MDADTLKCERLRAAARQVANFDVSDLPILVQCAIERLRAALADSPGQNEAHFAGLGALADAVMESAAPAPSSESRLRKALREDRDAWRTRAEVAEESIARRIFERG
jgi:hypothetical protein